jgi:hypothetical protein
MSGSSMRKISAVVAALIAGSIAALLLAGVGISSGPPPMPSASQMAVVGVTLGTPTTASPGTAAASAAQAAASKAEGANVVNSEYANCQVPGEHPTIDQDCFVELMDTGQGSGSVGWEIVLVDPTTSKPLAGYFERPSSPGSLPGP